ncbi:MAG: glycosyltransferase [Planctomycetes bacterium]|nr:glycosyltransferase [Planctomycetota bacterium]
MAKLGIALCITDLDVGGAERCLVDLATRLDRGRAEPVVYCLKPRPESDEASCVPALEAAGIEVHFLDAQRSWQGLRAVAALKRLLGDHKPDLVQTFLFHANLVGRIAARRAGVRCVVSGIRVAEQHSGWHLRADRLTSGMVDRYVCVSQSVARFSADRARLPNEKLVVIPHGIDAARYPASHAADLGSFGIRAGRRLVTYVGRLDRQKGLRWLIQAAPEWLRRLPECDLLLVGQGPERPKLELLCEDQRLGDRIRFAGWRGDVPEILAASHLLVLPSIWEGMPNVVLQAMASQLPVLATDVEGVRELLGPQADPQTVPYGDTKSLVENIVALMSDHQRAAELAARNRLRAENEFTLERVVAAYQDLWESLVGG